MWLRSRHSQHHVLLLMIVEGPSREVPRPVVLLQAGRARLQEWENSLIHTVTYVRMNMPGRWATFSCPLHAKTEGAICVGVSVCSGVSYEGARQREHASSKALVLLQRLLIEAMHCCMLEAVPAGLKPIACAAFHVQ